MSFKRRMAKAVLFSVTALLSGVLGLNLIADGSQKPMKMAYPDGVINAIIGDVIAKTNDADRNRLFVVREIVFCEPLTVVGTGSQKELIKSFDVSDSALPSGHRGIYYIGDEYVIAARFTEATRSAIRRGEVSPSAVGVLRSCADFLKKSVVVLGNVEGS